MFTFMTSQEFIFSIDLISTLFGLVGLDLSCRRIHWTTHVTSVLYLCSSREWNNFETL